MSLFGLGSTKTGSWIDPKTSDAQWGNYQGAQGLLGQYTPTSASQIQSYMSPYIEGVINPSLQALDRSRQMAVNGIGDQAQAAHAFGGSRHGVAEALTNEGFANQAGLLSANLYNQGYGQALDTAQGENRFGYQYPLARQGLLNQTLAGITPHTYGKNSSPTQAINNAFGLASDIGGLFGGFGGFGGSTGGIGAGGSLGGLGGNLDMLALAGG